LASRFVTSELFPTRSRPSPWSLSPGGGKKTEIFPSLNFTGMSYHERSERSLAREDRFAPALPGAAPVDGAIYQGPPDPPPLLPGVEAVHYVGTSGGPAYPTRAPWPPLGRQLPDPRRPPGRPYRRAERVPDAARPATPPAPHAPHPGDAGHARSPIQRMSPPLPCTASARVPSRAAVRCRSVCRQSKQRDPSCTTTPSSSATLLLQPRRREACAKRGRRDPNYKPVPCPPSSQK